MFFFSRRSRLSPEHCTLARWGDDPGGGGGISLDEWLRGFFSPSLNRGALWLPPSDGCASKFARRNYMEFAKAVATQLPQVTVDHELVFQFYRVCSEVHNCTLSATPKLLQHAGAAAPCYQVRLGTPSYLDFFVLSSWSCGSGSGDAKLTD